MSRSEAFEWVKDTVREMGFGGDDDIYPDFTLDEDLSMSNRDILALFERLESELSVPYPYHGIRLITVKDVVNYIVRRA